MSGSLVADFRAAMVAAAVAVSGLAGTGAAVAQDNPFTTLAPALIDEVGETWTLEMTGAGYSLKNTTNDNAFRYFWTVGDESEFGRRTISTTVTIGGNDPSAGAGLIYGYEEEPEHLYLFIIEPDGTAGLYQYGGDDVGHVQSVETDLVTPGENQLTLAEDGATIHMSVNGEEVMQYVAEDTGRGAVGIVAWGIGTYSFTGFTETVAAAAK